MTVARDLVCRWRQAAALPGDVVHVAKMHLLDSIGVGLAASRHQVGEPYRCFANQIANGGAASIFGASTGAAAADAALINGGLIHSLEFDDTHTASIAHGSSVMTACALAAAEASGASGSDLLRAYVLGWEALIRIGAAAPGSFQARGFQVSSVGGALVSALAAGELIHLDESRAVAAIGIALSQASGVFEFLSNGSTVKSMHPGWAAHSGIMAASLARAGLTGPETSFEGRFGLFRTFADDAHAADRFAHELATFGRQWRLMEAAYKFYPCCHYIHPFIEAGRLLQNGGATEQNVASIVLRVPEGASGIICEPWDTKLAAESGHAMRWSLPLVFASQMVHGQVDLATFDSLPNERVRQFASRIAWRPLQGAAFPQRFEAEAECRLANGDVRSVRVDDAFGNTSRPPDQEAILRKFRANASLAMIGDAAGALAVHVMALDNANDLAELGRLLRSAGR
jgi:2-methylcitrate dehydratase PrpD